MLINAHTKQIVHIPTNRNLTDHEKRSVIEVLVPATHKGHKFFRLDQRAIVKV